MRAVYVGSFDPAHLGHKNTYDIACHVLQIPIDIAICQNPYKTTFTFSLPERKRIAESVFTNSNIQLFYTFEHIAILLEEYDLIVRGYHNEEDINYVKKLLKVFNSENKFSSVRFFKIAKEYEDVSSSSIKQALLTSPQFAKKHLTALGYEMLINKIIAAD